MRDWSGNSILLQVMMMIAEEIEYQLCAQKTKQQNKEEDDDGERTDVGEEEEHGDGIMVDCG